MSEIPKYWIDFLKTNNISGIEIEIPENMDLSELGATFEIMNEEESVDEMNNYYPGLIVKKDNYIPIGSCSIGSGDPYFINTNDGPTGKLYRSHSSSGGVSLNVGGGHNAQE